MGILLAAGRCIADKWKKDKAPETRRVSMPRFSLIEVKRQVTLHTLLRRWQAGNGNQCGIVRGFLQEAGDVSRPGNYGSGQRRTEASTLFGSCILLSFHPETVLFRPGGVNLRDCLCGVPMYASSQSLDFLARTKNSSFPN